MSSLTVPRTAPLVVVLLACCVPDGSDDRVDPNSLSILGMQAPDPVLPGTIVSVDARGVADLDSTSLLLTRGDQVSVLWASSTDGFSWEFPIEELSFSAFGIGEHELDVQIRAGEEASPAWSWTATFADNLPVALSRLPTGTVSWGEEVVVTGTGFIYPGEGTSSLVIEGQYLPDDGEERSIDTSYTLVPIEAASRARASFRLEPNFGPVDSGQLQGEARVVNRLNDGTISESSTAALSFDIRPASVLDVSPRVYSVGQIIEIVGTGFVSDTQGTNVVLVEGSFLGDGGGANIDVELESDWVNEGLLRVAVEPIVDQAEGVLLDNWFGREWGTLGGQVSVRTEVGPERFTTVPLPVELELERQRQAIVLVFLSGFDSSLERFGLRAGSDRIRSRVLSRLEEIYTGHRVDFYDEMPDDIVPHAVSVVEVGGPDPNGLGLLGYDSTPGKDVGNLRLGDRIGGESAEIQEDGAAGYGGVFIESYLYWSADPALPGSRPEGAPFEDPLFDELFGGVRSSPATLSEVQNTGADPARNEMVRDAIRALGNIVGETVAHEVGHSLGLGDPFGPETSYHNPFGGEGCLMDSGVDRPLGERAGLPGFATTRFCDDSATYLRGLLGE